MVAARPGSALACKCPHPSLSSAVKKADAVFIGEVTDVRTGGSVHQLTVAVTAVWRGQVGATVVVESSASSCGIVTGGARKGRLFLFVAREDGGVFRVRQCDGSRRATSKVRASLIKLLGEPTVP